MKESRAQLILKYVLPTVLSQCAFFLFTIVDGIFVGHGVGSDALGAVNLAQPLVMVIGAVFMLTTIGGVTITAIRMGRKDYEGANQSFMHATAATVVVAIFFTVVGTVFTKPLAVLLGASGVYVEMVCDYLFWYTAFTIPSALAATLQGFGRNDGAPGFVMVSTIVSTALNIFLDWLFVFPLKQGLAGAAIATGISQTVGMLIVAVHFLMKRGHLHFARFKMDGKLMRKVLKRGLPEMLSQLATPITVFCMNLVIIRFLPEGSVNAYSVISYVVAFAYAVFIGVSEGMQPLFGQSYDDKNADDLRYFKRWGMIVSFIGSAVVYAAIMLLDRPICQMFGADATATELAVSAIPQYCWAFLFASVNTVLSAYLYSTKRTKESVAVNVLRGLIFTPLCVVALSFLTNGAILWFTVGIAEAITFASAMAITKRSESGGVKFDKD